MRLRGIDCLPIATASGTQGFFSPREYWHHFPCCMLGKSLRHYTRIAKTATVEARLGPDRGRGNMLMTKDGIRPREFFPPCIYFDFGRKIVLNSVSVTSPGFAALLATGKWQRRRGGLHFISFMSLLPTKDERLQEAREFVRLAKKDLRNTNAPIGVEHNLSCPNDEKVDPSDVVNEGGEMFDILSELSFWNNTPLIGKFAPDVNIKALLGVASHPACDAITMFNTLKFGKLPHLIPWDTLFPDGSPLAKFGGGALSGPRLFPLMCEGIATVRGYGYSKPIWACGGIYNAAAVDQVEKAGASGVQISTVSFMNPIQTRFIRSRALDLFA